MNKPVKVNTIKTTSELIAINCEQIDRLNSINCNVAKEAKRASAIATCTGKVFQGMALQLRYAKDHDGASVPAIEGPQEPAPTADEVKAAQEIIKRAKAAK